jgi:hypothetical protein
MNDIAETNSTKNMQITKQMHVSSSQSRTYNKRMRGHYLVSATHKVADHHLYHEWQCLVMITPHKYKLLILEMLAYKNTCCHIYTHSNTLTILAPNPNFPRVCFNPYFVPDSTVPPIYDPMRTKFSGQVPHQHKYIQKCDDLQTMSTNWNKSTYLFKPQPQGLLISNIRVQIGTSLTNILTSAKHVWNIIMWHAFPIVLHTFSTLVRILTLALKCNQGSCDLGNTKKWNNL